MDINTQYKSTEKNADSPCTHAAFLLLCKEKLPHRVQNISVYEDLIYIDLLKRLPQMIPSVIKSNRNHLFPSTDTVHILQAGYHNKYQNCDKGLVNCLLTHCVVWFGFSS